jgi:hypothetical protein
MRGLIFIIIIVFSFFDWWLRFLWIDFYFRDRRFWITFWLGYDFFYRIFFVFLSFLVIFRSRSWPLGSRRRIIYDWEINYYYSHSCYFYAWFIEIFVGLMFCSSVIEIYVFVFFFIRGDFIDFFRKFFVGFTICLRYCYKYIDCY